MNTAERLLNLPEQHELFSELLKEIRALRMSGKDELWDVSDIATYLRYAKSTVHNKIITIPTFPRAVVIATADARNGTKRWKAEEVRQWAIRIREAR